MSFRLILYDLITVIFDTEYDSSSYSVFSILLFIKNTEVFSSQDVNAKKKVNDISFLVTDLKKLQTKVYAPV